MENPTESLLALPDELQRAAALAWFEQVLLPPEDALEAYSLLREVGDSVSIDALERLIEDVGIEAPSDYEGKDSFTLNGRDLRSAYQSIVELSEPAFTAVSSEKDRIQQDFLGRAHSMLAWQEKLPQAALDQWADFRGWVTMASQLDCEDEFFGKVAHLASLRTQGCWAEHFSLGQRWDKKFSQWQSAVSQSPRNSLNWLDLLLEAPEKDLDRNHPRGSWKPAHQEPNQYVQNAFQKLLEDTLVTFVRVGGEEGPRGPNLKMVIDALRRKGFVARPAKLAWGRLMPSASELRSQGGALMLWRFRKMVSLLDAPVGWLEDEACSSRAFPPLNGSSFLERFSEHINRQAEGEGVVLANLLQDIHNHNPSNPDHDEVTQLGVLLETLRSAGRLDRSLPGAPQEAVRPRM